MELNKSLKKFSSFNIRKILKNILDFKYKMLHETHPKTFMDENIRQFYESAYLQLKLEAGGFEVIYIDEFSFNTRKQKYKGWVRKGKHGFLKKIDDDISISCVVAFSRKAIYGIAGSKGALNSQHFIQFLQNLHLTLRFKF